MGYYSHVWSINHSTEASLLWTTAIDASSEYPVEYQALEEPSLLTLDNNDEIYRLGIFRSFDGVAIVTIDMKLKVMGVKFSKAWGYPQPGPEVKRTFNLSSEELFEFKSALADSQFLKILPASKNMPQGKDGSTWIFEVKRNGQYAAMSRWSPKSGPLYEVGSYIYHMANSYVPMGSLY